MSSELRRAFFEDLAVQRDDSRRRARLTLTNEIPRWASAEHREALEKLRSSLTSETDVEAFAMVVQEFVDIALHSALVAIDGGSASSAVGRLTLVGPDGESLGDGLHELFVEYLFDTGRVE